MKTMGGIIAQKRKEKGLTQAQLAIKMSVTDKAVSKWERNLSCPDVNSLSALADALDIPVSELLDAKNKDTQKDTPQEIIGLILKVIPLAMGVALTVLAIIGEIDMKSGFILTGIGLACMGLGVLNNEKQ